MIDPVSTVIWCEKKSKRRNQIRSTGRPRNGPRADDVQRMDDAYICSNSGVTICARQSDIVSRIRILGRLLLVEFDRLRS